MSNTSKLDDWTKPAAMAIPEGGYFKDKVEQGRYGPIFPKTPACYGFSIIAKIIPGRESAFYEYAKTIKRRWPSQPDVLAVLKLHYLRWVLFAINGETYFMYIRASSTPTSTNTPRMPLHFLARLASIRFSKISRASRRIGKRTLPAFIKFVRDHQCPSFLEYGEYPYVSADEIKKALKLKAAFSNMLDQMQ